ncbi:FxLYD domain-containing protein [Paenibacillus sp. PL91]|uniref:FxLYD domain-containing protein n=1 Tax=Paenibacillus sp. PL91 TaxID=2729538 RepID=UPI00145DB530|nr:FxLYD domain-containing protein [Paenibacillus sp. PL91]MBC9201495.1 zinc-ribbon domain-containing protein [Paenibacillus sp. PL91]
MYCHHCGKKRTDDAIYCSQCGRLLAMEEGTTAAVYENQTVVLSETAVSIETSYERELASMNTSLTSAVRRRNTKRTIWAWLMPIMLAIVTAGSLFSYFLYQSGMNDRVVQLHAKAKEEALAGKYAEAQALLKEALTVRPGFAAAKKDAEVVEHVAALSQSLAIVGKKLEEQKQTEAEELLEPLKSELKGHTEPIYAKVKEQLGEYKVQLELMKLTEELADLNTVDELAAKLNVANHLEGEEASAVQEQILAKIVDISCTEAEAFLKTKQYSDALEVTERALEFAKDNEQLAALEKKINKAQSDYEKTEQQRLEHAMQQAAAEDLKNQTAAVEVIKIDSMLDEFGDLTITAELKNAATRPIYSITVKFKVYDAAGVEVGSGTAAATPDYVDAGEKMSFTSTVYGIHVENTTVVVDHATWYLD